MPFSRGPRQSKRQIWPDPVHRCLPKFRRMLSNNIFYKSLFWTGVLERAVLRLRTWSCACIVRPRANGSTEHDANSLLPVICFPWYGRPAGLQRLRFKSRQSGKQDRKQANYASSWECTDWNRDLQPVLARLRITLALWTLYGLTAETRIFLFLPLRSSEASA